MIGSPSIRRFDMELPYILGSTTPCPTAVHMEPFSTSVLKVPIWIFHTTTKICTRGHLTRARTGGCITTPVPSYSLRQAAHPDGRVKVPSLFRASCYSRWVATHPLAGSNLHGHHPAVYSNQRLLLGLMSIVLSTLTSRSLHPTSPVPLVKNGPLGTCIPSLASFRQVRNLTNLKFEKRLRLRLLIIRFTW